MEFRLFQVDAFAKQVFEGNPAAVIPLEDWLPDASLQAIAAENNLSETAYFVEEEGGFHLRWFTPTKEVRLCGHATLAAAHVLYEHLEFNQPQIEFRTLAGKLTVKKTATGYAMDFPLDRPHPLAFDSIVHQALGLKPSAVLKGTDDLLVRIESEQDLQNLKPDFQKIESLEARGLIVTVPGSTTDFASRCFYPAYGINEDPVTGSAHTLLAPYWAEQLNKKRLSAVQGKSRKGYLQVEVNEDRVLLEGSAVTYLEGIIRW